MSEVYVQMLEQRVAALERRLDRMARQAASNFALSRSTAAPLDSGPIQTIQGRLDPVSLRDGMPMMLNYGYSSALPRNGDKLVVFLGGDRSQAVVVATNHQDHRFRGLAEGEVAIYDMWGHSIHLQESGILVTGDLNVTGGVTAGYGTANRLSLQTHRHQNDSHGDTEGPPILGM